MQFAAMISFAEFKKSLNAAQAPEQLSVYLKALWYDGKGDWHSAHDLVDSLENQTACWVHAYLHRKEGDNGNARYWYSKAGKNFSLLSLDEEWEYIAKYLINEAQTA